jgi:dTMP kinase
MSIERGTFIVFEGGDRVGKTTQATQVVECFRAFGKKVVYLSFPNRSSATTGDKINSFLKGEIELSIEEAHTLFCQNRAEVADYITHLLSEGTNVVLDRYAFSGLAYTMAKWRKLGLSKEDLKVKRQWAINEEVRLPAPDIIFYLELKPDEMAARFVKKEEIFDDIEFQKLVNEEFAEMIQNSNVDQLIWIYVNASMSIDKIHKHIVERYSTFRHLFHPNIAYLDVY